jgi:hypothetical protein
MDPKHHFQSLTQELECLKDRVRHFIDHRHPPSDGEWKESVLRSMLAQRLPDTVKVGRGFILRPGDPSTQCDVLLYRADHPLPFRDGDFVFVPADAVLAVIEVKTKLDRESFRQALDTLANIGQVLPKRDPVPILGLFSYEKDGDPRAWFSDEVPPICNSRERVVDLVSAGCHDFLKWWCLSPDTVTAPGDPAIANPPYGKWHSYHLPNMAAGYFLANVIDLVTRGLVSRNDSIWFPVEGKEAIGQRVVIDPDF